MATRTLTIRITEVSGGDELADTGRTDIYLKDQAGTTLGTATETPANSGQYVLTISATPKYGTWYAGASPYNAPPIWLGEIAKRVPAHVNVFRKVEVYDVADSPSGAKGAAKTFTTGTAPLGTDAAGNTTFAFTAIPIVILASPYQEAQHFLSTDPSLSGSNVTFGITASDLGNPAGDGKTYCDIIIVSVD